MFGGLLSRRRTVWAGAAVAGLVASGCGKATEPDEKRFAFDTAPVTFVVTGIVPEVWRVDIAVNGRYIDALFGSFETADTDRVTIPVPQGDSLNAFARAFEGDSVILYIGEAYFNVRGNNPIEVPIALNYKGPHAPTPRRAR